MAQQPYTTETIAYLRVSTDEQADSGLGLEAQRAAIAAECERRKLNVSRWFADEGISGSTIDGRPGLLAALDALKPGLTLIVAKRDRLARGDAFLSAWIEKEVATRRATVISAAGEGNGDDPTSVLMRRIVDAFAEYELLMIKARTKAALAVKRRRGERVSRFAPYGYRHDGHGRWLPDQHEQQAVKLMQRWRDNGLSLRDIGARLEKRGFLSRAGTQLSARTVRSVLMARQAA